MILNKPTLFLKFLDHKKHLLFVKKRLFCKGNRWMHNASKTEVLIKSSNEVVQIKFIIVIFES